MRRTSRGSITKRAAAAGLAATLLVGVVAWKAHAPPPAPVVAAPAGRPLEVQSLPAGAVATYAAAFRASSTVSLPGLSAPLASRLELDGDLALESHGAEAGGLAVSLRWTALRRASLDAMGTSSAATLEGELRAAPVVLVFAPGPHLAELRIAEGASPAARVIQRALAVEIAAAAEGAFGTSDVVSTSIGRARVLRGGDGFSHATYVDLDALGAPEDVQVESHGRGAHQGARVTDLAHDETVTATGAGPRVDGASSELHLSLHLLRETTGEAHPAPRATALALRPEAPAATTRAASLERRATGVTAESTFADVRTAALFPRDAGTAWVWRDAAWLELHPDEAEPLLARADRDLSLTGLAAAFDVVVVSGTPTAQRALVATLERVASRDDGTFDLLIQRLGHLKEPSAETLAFAARHYREERQPHRRAAAAYATGALARHALEAAARTDGPPRPTDGQSCAASPPCASRLALGALEADLARATSDPERVTLLRALGNGGQTSSLRAVAPHARSTDVDVRRAVAAAVRNMEASEVVDLLLGLARDADGGVVREALSSLFRKGMDDDDWKALGAIVAEGRMPSDAHHTLVQGLATRTDDDPHAETILLQLLASDSVAPRLKLQIESALRR